MVRRTVRPLASISGAIRAFAAGRKDTSIPATEVTNEIGDIARAAEVFRRTLVDADAAREAAVRALPSSGSPRRATANCSKPPSTASMSRRRGRLFNANPALARIMGYDTPEQLIANIGDMAQTDLCSCLGPRGVSAPHAPRRRGARFEYQVRRKDGGILWLSDSATVVRDETAR